MGKRRKVPVIDEEKENEEHEGSSTSAASSLLLHGPMYTIMANIQLNETFHKKYIKEMKQLYEKMDHDAFMFTFVNLIKTAMEADEANEFSLTTLTFCAKFVTSYNTEDTHPLLIDTFKWLLSTVSKNPHIRYRLCQYVNMILKALGPEAALDDGICDRILEYMLDRMCDVSPSVRLQAILAMQRLQIPDNPDDPVLRAYQFHLCSDPSPRVRQAVITCMGRNFNTIPYILDRLWDIDEKVRRHTYLHMSSFPVRSYKVSQRVTLLEQGLHDRCEAVRKVVITIMLQQWIESYQKNLIALITALKLDANEAEIDRFRKITQKALKEVFPRQPTDELLSCLTLHEEGEFRRCVPVEALTLELAIYWQCLTEYLTAKEADELDLVVPELSVFCAYVESFCAAKCNYADKFEQMEFMYVLLSLMEILYTYDLGDETGRGNLKTLLGTLIKSYALDQRVIGMVVKCAENLITDQNERLQFFIDIIRELCELNSSDLLHNRNLINELLAECRDADLNIKLSSLKVKLLDLEEQETDLLKQKDFVRAHVVTEEKNTVMDQFMKLLKPLLDKQQNAEKNCKTLNMNRQVRNDSILKCLQLTFNMIASPRVNAINSNVCQLYHEFVCRHIASNQIVIRDWALRCGTAYSMLYEPLAKDVFEELYSQFFKNHNIRIWETSIGCIFELLDRYGVDNFVEQEEVNKQKKTNGRQLYNTLDFLDDEEEAQSTLNGQGVGVIYMMSHFLDTCDDVCIIKAIIKGFCQLVLRGYIKSSDIIEKLLLRYFNPSIEPEINQMLGIFLKNMFDSKLHSLLEPCLLPTISTVLSAPYDSPLHEIRPETIARFFIDFTRQEATAPVNGECLHNKIAHSFLQEMLNNVSNKELCKLLAKELLTLELNVQQQQQLKQDMKTLADKLIKCEFDPKTIKNIIDFKDMLDGIFTPKLKPNGEEQEDSDDEDDEETLTNDKETNSARSVSTDVAMQSVPTQQSDPTLVAAVADTTSETTITASDVNASTANAMAETIVQQVSPPKTMYGADNSIRHRSLRRSLNQASAAGVGNKRKNAASPTAVAGRSLRSARLQKRAKEANSKTQNSEPAKSRTRAQRKSKSKSPTPTPSQQVPTTPKPATRKSASPKAITPKSSSPKHIEQSPVRSQIVHIVVYAPTPSKTQSKQRNATPSRTPAQADAAAELNTSDIVPASPQSEQPSVRGPATRLRRAVLVSRKPSSPAAAAAATATKFKAAESSATPVRNGRKRMLSISPKLRVTALTSEAHSQAAASPLRKQMRADPSKTPARQTATALTRQPSGERSESNSTATSPSSVKENTVPDKTKTPSTPLRGVVVKSVSLTTASTPLRSQRAKPASAQKTTDSRSQSLERSITTRQLASKERQNSMIMTRKRLSLDLNSTQRGKHSPLQQPTRKKPKFSKIPVSVRGKTTQPTSSSNSSVSSYISTTTTTSSSSSEEVSSQASKQRNTHRQSRLPQRIARATRQRN